MKRLTQNMFTAAAVAILGFGAGAPAHADDLDIAQSPLFVATNVEPNVMFTLDDSGSMQWEFMPDGNEFRFTIFMFPRPNNLYGSVTNYANQVPSWRNNNLHHYFGRSAANNGVFYNPDITYRPWSRPDGSDLPDADPTNALYNPDIPALGGLDLTTEQTGFATWFRGGNFNEGICDPCGGNRDFTPITYFNYLGGPRTLRSSYQLVEIDVATTPAGATFTSPGGITRTRDEEIQNFANWFQYHRSRVLTSRGAIGNAFTQLPDQARVGFAAINQGSSEIDGVNTRAVLRPVRPFSVAGREAFYNELYGREIGGNTPLRRAANAVGEYFERVDARGPWSTTPGSNGGEDLACRQSFHIMMSDGFWNGPNPGVGDADGTPGATITGPDTGAGPQSYQYLPVPPFADSTEINTLADVAMHYWKRDLRPDVPNRVSTTPEDPAFWQHLASFGIGLGVEGNIDPDDAFAAIDTGTPINWGDPFSSNPAKIDDLLHFGLNGRGGYFSAADPETFAEELGNILTEIVARTSATTGLSVSSTRLTEGSIIYSAEFDSEDWSGNVKAIDVFEGTTEWEAGPQLDARSPGSRQIITSQADGTGTEVFSVDDLSPTLKTLIDVDVAVANDVIEYVRGERGGEEQFGGTYRDRNTILADIVNSRPVYMGEGNEGWARLDGSAGSAYPGFVDDKVDDSKVVFVGGNGGMLHAFDAESGSELFGFVPRAVLDKLGDLADPSYGHRFFVDGQMVVRDAFDGTWKRVLVGGLGAGGRGIYALDVTDPSSPEVLWEITGDDEPDLGFTFGDPVITRIGNETSADWVAIFGNGYNSDDNTATLFVVDLFDGTIREEIELEGASGDNGLSGVAPLLDPETRLVTSRIYAGDLNGTVWRVDFDGSGSPSVKYPNGLFTDPDSRPITSTPGLAASPTGGLFVYVGTGKLIEQADRLVGGTAVERFYALRDQNTALGTSPAFGTPTLTESGGERVLTGDVGEDGWVLDLTPSGSPTGERVLSRARIIFGQVIFSTFEPEDDPCAPGGIQRLYVVDALSGAGALDNICPNCGVVEVGIGAPIDPPIIIKPPSLVGDDGDGDPDDPFDPGGGMPDPDTVGSRDGWCSEFGTLNPVTGEPLLIGTICDGRQVWRQAR